ncbi:hypothetical protein LAJ19_07630 [Deinococcus taeanensis]|uniref:hypothetical protein n=1 Tax=Deinococcus taeanensis TaxID=2737050 RepID=UPI001CDD3960|nr:hypothetical protein [Deinococcus taeanensis]UBV41537.1 hypothetical protein LAJ19_07630 [Deinococcus taeanensis]
MRTALAALLPLGTLLGACAPVTQANPTLTYAGEVRVLLRPQRVRVTYTVNPVTHDARGQYRNLSSGDSFALRGTQLPGPAGAVLTATIDPGETPRLNASLLGFGVSNVPLKAAGLLTGTVTGETLTGTLRVNGLAYPFTLRAER